MVLFDFEKMKRDVENLAKRTTKLEIGADQAAVILSCHQQKLLIDMVEKKDTSMDEPEELETTAKKSMISAMETQRLNSNTDIPDELLV